MRTLPCCTLFRIQGQSPLRFNEYPKLQAANFAVSGASYILLGKRHFFGDEFAIDWHFHLSMGTFRIITAAIAVGVLMLVVFKFIPAKQRFTFITAGLAGGVTGYLFWLVWFGKLIMP